MPTVALAWCAGAPSFASAQAIASGHGVAGHSALFHVLLALVVVLIASRAVGRLFQRIGQPAVMGEIVAGIALGPSLLGRVLPDTASFLFPTTIMPQLSTIAQIGVVLYLFLIGLELDTRGVQQRVRAASAIAIAGIAVPLCLGASVANLLHPMLAPAGVAPLAFSAFFAVSLAVTAFPVLARIVAERRLEKSPLGIMALACAAADDLAAWCLLSVVVGLVRVQATGLHTVGFAFLYLAIMFGLVRPLLTRLVAREEGAPTLTRGTMSALFALVMLSAMSTEWIGVHALFGAFLVGALIPAESALAHRLTSKLDDVVCSLFLPVFFAITGLRTQIGALDDLQSWLVCGLIVVLAFLGKLGGVSVAARVSGLSWRSSVQLGALMNTRGLMELIVLNVGLDLGIISPTLFAMMVLMALITTFAAAPLLNWIGGDEQTLSDAPPAHKETAPLVPG